MHLTIDVLLLGSSFQEHLRRRPVYSLKLNSVDLLKSKPQFATQNNCVGRGCAKYAGSAFNGSFVVE